MTLLKAGPWLLLSPKGKAKSSQALQRRPRDQTWSIQPVPGLPLLCPDLHSIPQTSRSHSFWGFSLLFPVPSPRPHSSFRPGTLAFLRFLLKCHLSCKTFHSHLIRILKPHTRPHTRAHRHPYLLPLISSGEPVTVYCTISLCSVVHLPHSYGVEVGLILLFCQKLFF